MKRRNLIILAAFLSLLLTFLLCPGTDAGAQETSPGVAYDLNQAGVRFELPEELQNLKGVIQPAYGMEVSQGSGLYLSALTYCAIEAEKYKELAAKGANLTQEDIDFIGPRMFEFLLVYTLDGGRNLEDLTAILTDYGLPMEGVKELGTAGDYSFFYLTDPFREILDDQAEFDEGFREEYDNVVLAACEEPDWIQIYEPEVPAAGEGMITFETTDLDGNAVSSADVFGKNKITMVNLWGTYCGPCINEMPDLQELGTRLADKGCGIIGVVVDVAGADDTAMVETAKEILADTGVTYLNLIPWAGLGTALPAQFIPTTYFIDSNGEIVGDPAVGARGADEYEALLDAVLATLE